MRRGIFPLFLAGLFFAVVLHAAEPVEIPGVIDDLQPAMDEKASPSQKPSKENPPPLPPVTETDPVPAARPPLPPQPERQEIIPMPRPTSLGEPDLPRRPEPARAPSTPAAPPVPTETGMQGAVATLDNEPLSRAELTQALMDAHGREVFDRLINVRLLRAEMIRRNLAIPRPEIDAAFASHLQRLTKNEPKAVEPDAFLRYHFGLSAEDYKQNVIWVELALKRLARTDLQITEADLFNHYWANRKAYSRPEEVRVRHILISPYAFTPQGDSRAQIAGEGAWRRALEVALEVQAKLREGADFPALAKTCSHDKGSAAHGGDLGFFARGVMVKPFEDAAFALKPEEMSELVKTTLGYHIILSVERTEESLRPFPEVKEQVQKDYEEYLVLSVSTELLNRLRRSALESGRLRILDPQLAPAAP